MCIHAHTYTYTYTLYITCIIYLPLYIFHTFIYLYITSIPIEMIRLSKENYFLQYTFGLFNPWRGLSKPKYRICSLTDISLKS